MTPPYQQRGQPISPSAFNALIDLVRSHQITGVTGGSFNRTSNGTTLNIFPRGGTSGGTNEAPKCWFKLSDATEEETIKIEIQQDQIAGRYPEGMGLGFPAFKITISANTYFYISVKYNTTTLEIDSASDAIQIVDSDTLKQATTNTIYILIGTVVVEADKVKTIDNICDRPIPSPCDLAWGSPPSP